MNAALYLFRKRNSVFDAKVLLSVSSQLKRYEGAKKKYRDDINYMPLCFSA